ncbi:MAG: hypothetical protein NC201_01175 [Prevotella sp.]|nr:hypothetical protein [Bacteroides sp.]MCM1365839.1 hypothetical protein [Prevotella sp.]MCM1436469.1 hypothetical protein [Prevotella sp.]
MNTNLLIQYTVVAIIILIALIWIILRVTKIAKKKDANTGCCGCSLKTNCNSRKHPEKGCNAETEVNNKDSR